MAKKEAFLCASASREDADKVDIIMKECGRPVLDALQGRGFSSELSLPKGLSRRYGQRQLHFVTFRGSRRWPLLGTVRARNVFVKMLGEVRDLYRFALAGDVLMPEPVHLLIGDPPEGTPPTVLPVLKQRVSRQMRRAARKRSCTRQLPLRFDNEGQAWPPFWQPRFYDCNVWSQSKYVEKLHYLHRNPGKRKRVAPPRDWPWSSFSFYAKRDSGLLAIDPLRSSGLLGLQSKPPPFQIRRTGHPNFKYVQSPGHPPYSQK
jgi:putative transposase